MQGRKREALQKLLSRQRMEHVTYKEVFDNRTGALKHTWVYDEPRRYKTGDTILDEEIINGKRILVHRTTGEIFCELPAGHIKR